MKKNKTKNNIHRVLVTGGAGFIGSHVVDELLSQGYTVRIMDNLCPPTHNGTIPEWVNSRAEFVRGDVTIKKDWERSLKKVDAVIHLAAYMDFHTNFSGYVKTNIESVALLFEVIHEKKIPIKKIVAASSQSVYGEGKYHCSKHGLFYASPRLEENIQKHIWEQTCPLCKKKSSPIAEQEDDILNPLTPYGISKLTSELMLQSLGKEYSIPVVMLRFSIVLGARQSFRHFYSGALRSFAVNVLNKKPIAMNEDGYQLRDFVHVSDVAKAHVVVLVNEKANFESFNVGSGKAITVIDLAKKVALECGVAYNPKLTNRFRVGSTRHSVMDVSKLQKLGWSPHGSVELAIHEYVQWIRQFKGLQKILSKTEQSMKKDKIIKNY